jgi:hypothetical protein
VAATLGTESGGLMIVSVLVRMERSREIPIIVPRRYADIEKAH